MTEARGEVTGKKPAQTADEAKRLPGPSIADTARDPLAVTVRRACELSELGLTTMWKLIKQGRLETRHVPGVDRTLISFASLQKLLAPASENTAAVPPPRRPRGSRRASR